MLSLKIIPITSHNDGCKLPLSLSDETVMSVSLGTDWDFPDLGRGYSSIWSKCSLLAAVVIGRSTIEADVTS